MAEVLQLSDIHKRYGGGKAPLVEVLHGIDLTLAGEHAAGLDDDDAARTALRNRYLGFVFQFHHLLPAFSALKNVLMPSFAGSGRLDPARQQRARSLLERVGLADHAYKRPVELSGGQQQRMAIVRALMTTPRLALADGPTGNLDPQTAAEVFRLMHDINREDGVTFLVVTHDEHLAATPNVSSGWWTGACWRREQGDGRGLEIAGMPFAL
ncbi:MAG: ATP-binding cassette domain-containing protein [Pseudogulbenkiania sp.]|nr:ATP-binding cassette domain-containing protein [Pseudogulbenkiania sp.]